MNPFRSGFMALSSLEEPALRNDIQQTLTPRFKTTYNGPQYNFIKGRVQRIELHRGCEMGETHDYCLEPKINVDFPIPEIVRNQVQILDMAFLNREDPLGTIKELGRRKVNDRTVYYELVCGFQFWHLTQEIAQAAHFAHFIRPRLAWDGPLKDQYALKDALRRLDNAGYFPKEMMLFMLVNWKIPYEDCLRKLDLMKVWNVKVCDCCYDGGYRYATPRYWTAKQLKDIRARSRKHNMLVNFEIDPSVKA